MDTKALNEKLLKFVGLVFEKHYIKFSKTECESISTTGYYFNGKFIRKSAPDLVHDLNAQAKYIYPKLAERKLRIEFRKDFDEFNGHLFSCYWTIFDGMSIVGNGEDMDNPALAFALAVEKLIDRMEKSND